VTFGRSTIDRDLRADREQGNPRGVQGRPQRLVIIGQRDVAGRTAAKAEEDQHGRTLPDQFDTRHAPTVRIDQIELPDTVARTGTGSWIVALHQHAALRRIFRQLFGRPGPFAFGLKLGKTFGQGPAGPGRVGYRPVGHRQDYLWLHLGSHRRRRGKARATSRSARTGLSFAIGEGRVSKCADSLPDKLGQPRRRGVERIGGAQDA
jgi:hypothetical protein